MFTANTKLIQVINQCADTCDYCASSCLQEKDVTMMANCIRLDMECASICKTTALLLHLESNHVNAACQLCADICSACADECEKHEHEHCKKCAAICRECAEQCMSTTAA